MIKKVYLKTWGCQMNIHDSEKMLGVLIEEGYISTHDPRKADLIIFNTCSIRQKAEQKFYSELGKLKLYRKRKKETQIAVAGCIAQQEGKNIIKKAPYVDFVFGPQNIHMLKDLIKEKLPVISTDDNPEIAVKDLPVDRGNKVKAWISIVYGCNNFCSYCVVPYTRGHERSRPSENIIAEVKELALKGYKEVTLLGQNVNSYKSDIDFPSLLEKLNRIDGIERIRFVTSHPKDLSDRLIDAISDLSKVCEHIHLPLQSGSNDILSLMNRRYTYDEYLQKVLKLRRKIPGIAITSDIIAGFSGEKYEDHLLTIKALKEIKFDGIFAFKFSPRPQTKASKIKDNLSEEAKSERLYEILQVQDDITLEINKSLEGTVQEVLIEGESKTDEKKLAGRTRTNKIVNVLKNSIENTPILNVEIIKGSKHSLEGIPL